MIHVMIRVFMWPMVSTSRVLHEPPGNQYLAEPAAAESLEEDQIQAWLILIASQRISRKA